ncbi:hypothetical protein [Nocardia wallacei]|uniref:hypothetical protein n=1 Tax=Nocardia wallacei TaxID=480035 RepID=UPI0024538680|nr:hypothetical protein [Nocardia wallacei]
MAEQVRVIGGRRLRATMRRAGVDMQELNRAHAAAARIVADAARAPVASGRLQSTIRPGATRTQAIVRAGYASVPYAGVIHWGWPRRNIRAQPFLSDAATSTESTWIKSYEDEIERIISQIEGA